MAKLFFYDEKEKKVEIELTEDMIRVGRYPDNDIVLNDIFVSRHHATIIKEGETYAIVDNGSKYGTFVNEEKIVHRRIKYGDELKIGNIIITFVDNTFIDEMFEGKEKTVQGADLDYKFSVMQSELDKVKRSLTDKDQLKDNIDLFSKKVIEMDEEIFNMRRAFEETQNTARNLNIMYNVGKLINSVVDVRMLINIVMDLSLKVVEAERGYILIYDKEKNELLPQVSRNISKDVAASKVYKLSTTIVKKVFNSKEPVLSVNAQGDDRFDAAQSVILYNIKSVLAVPLLNKDQECIGIIYVDNTSSSKSFTEADRDLLAMFGNYVAIAIETAELFAKIKNEERIRDNLKRYLSPNIVDNVIQNKGELKLGGRKHIITTLFSDIRGFTSMSEKMSPEEVVSLLNEYFTEMTGIIFKYEGTLDKFIGDCIMAVYGAPIIHTDDPIRAIKTALEMQTAIKKLNKKWESEGRKTLGVGIGINTGETIAGNIGSPERMDYTVISDAVNLAERIEAVAPAGKVLISENTYNLIKEKLKCKEYEPIKVKGKEKAVKIYEVLSLKV